MDLTQRFRGRSFERDQISYARVTGELSTKHVWVFFFFFFFQLYLINDNNLERFDRVYVKHDA